MEAGGLPLLSGPPPTMNSGRAEIGCRKCGKEFNVLFNRSRRCSHCGYYYCQNCTDYQALMPRSSNGYDPVDVCGFCIEMLTITSAGKSMLKSMPLAKLKKYIAAYNIRVDRAVEKEDFIDAILAVKGPNGCLPVPNEHYYRTYSVPDRTNYERRGFFARATSSSRAQPPPPMPPRPRPQQQQTPDFARPDLEPDPPLPSQGRPPNVPPRPQPSPASFGYPPRPEQRPPPPRPHWQYNPPPAPPRPTPRPTTAPPPQQQSRPRPRSPPVPPPQSSRPDTAPPRQRATSAFPPPSLDELLAMSSDAIAALSVTTLKAILFQNHVNARLIIEKGELVQKVSVLVDDERQERERARLAEEAEEQERIRQQHEMMEELERNKRKREEEERAARGEGEGGGESKAKEGGSSSSAPPPPPPRSAHFERNGLCVICQDEEANIAIVDCGHLAMCRSCSELVMSSSKECPLCRTRIVTEARLLRIFKT